jgi:hypothetical protein
MTKTQENLSINDGIDANGQDDVANIKEILSKKMDIILEILKEKKNNKKSKK